MSNPSSDTLNWCPYFYGVVKAQVGYQCKQRTNGPYSNVFNWFWTSSSLQAWIDVTNVGTVCDYRIKARKH